MAPDSTTPAASETPESPSTEQVTTPEQQQDDKPITRRELDAAIELGFRRAQQSSRARSQNIETKVNELTEQFKKLNVPVTPEMTAKMRETAAAEIDQAEQPDTQPGDQPNTGNPVYDWTMDLYRQEQLDIKPTDPEWAAIKAALDDPSGNMIKYQRTVISAIDKKRARIASESESANARIVGGSTSNSGAVAQSTRQLWENAHKK